MGMLTVVLQAMSPVLRTVNSNVASRPMKTWLGALQVMVSTG
jgi:hypothetical protein